MTAYIEGQLKHLPGNTILDNIECKRMSCRISIEIDEKQADAIMGRYPFMVAPLSTISGPSSNAGGTRTIIPFYLSFDPDLLDEAQYSKYLSDLLAQQKAGSASQP